MATKGVSMYRTMFIKEISERLEFVNKTYKQKFNLSTFKVYIQNPTVDFLHEVYKLKKAEDWQQTQYLLMMLIKTFHETGGDTKEFSKRFAILREYYTNNEVQKITIVKK